MLLGRPPYNRSYNRVDQSTGAPRRKVPHSDTRTQSILHTFRNQNTDSPPSFPPSTRPPHLSCPTTSSGYCLSSL
ncbi:hypothetical protein SLA2020_156750 [Shorea laevis]